MLPGCSAGEFGLRKEEFDHSLQSSEATAAQDLGSSIKSSSKITRRSTDISYTNIVKLKKMQYSNPIFYQFRCYFDHVPARTPQFTLTSVLDHLPEAQREELRNRPRRPSARGPPKKRDVPDMGDMGWFKEINFTGEQQAWGFRGDLMGLSTETK